jgi:hypothetical protein
MPRETIRISLSNPFCPEPGAIFLSKLAYPSAIDASARHEFMSALCRWAITEICDIDRDWATSPQPIKAGFFLGKRTDSLKALKLGSKKLVHRVIAAGFIAMPHLHAQLQGSDLIKYQGYRPTVQMLSYDAMESMGWKGDSESTLKSRIWGPSRPVIHAAAMLGVHRCSIELPFTKTLNDLLPYLKFPELLREVFVWSEIARLHLPLIKEFRIKEEDTIQFLAE